MGGPPVLLKANYTISGESPVSCKLIPLNLIYPESLFLSVFKARGSKFYLLACLSAGRRPAPAVFPSVIFYRPNV